MGSGNAPAGLQDGNMPSFDVFLDLSLRSTEPRYCTSSRTTAQLPQKTTILYAVECCTSGEGMQANVEKAS
jgi:hypothetical protein